MSENVKIKINEYDRTSPSGRGIDSTDIAFIPGFSCLATAPKNQPTLVTSTREFEQLFGKQPRVLTTKDVASYSSYGFKAGDYDRSYVYAKELLYQGMPVVYSNLFDKDGYTDITISDNTLMFNPNKIPTCMTIAYDSTKGEIVITSSKSTENETVLFQFATSVSVTGRKTETFEFLVTSDDCEVVSCSVDPESFRNAMCAVTKLSDTQYELKGAADFADDVETLKVSVTVEARLTTVKGDTIKLHAKQPSDTYSVLDCFYGVNPVIKEQLAVGTPELPVNSSISDKSIYSVKYITSGGYPSVLQGDKYSASSKFATEMMTCAENRGDAVALIDYQCSPDAAVYSTDPKSGSVYSNMQALFGGAGTTSSSYGAAMYPWATYNTTFGKVTMPASFGYLMCVAKALKSSPNWLAMAGVSRGLVPSIQELCVPNEMISNKYAEEMQPKFGVKDHNLSINTITNIRPYGLTLWGNRTMMPVSSDGTTALNFLNTRNMLSDIKKLLYTTAKSCMFEQNSTDLWIKFKAGIEPLLRRLKAGNGISDYKIVRGTTKYDGNPLTKGEIAAVIKIYPMYAVEYFELAVEINDEDVTVS